MASVAPQLGSLSDITLPNVKASCWTASWITALQSLTRLCMNGFSIRAIPGNDVLQRLRRLRALDIRVTRDAVAMQLAHLTDLRDLRLSFGKAGSAPSCDALAIVLHSCRQLSRLHFTFAQAFAVTTELLFSFAGLESLEDLQINSFDVSQLPADCLRPLSALQSLRCVELSGMNRLENK